MNPSNTPDINPIVVIVIFIWTIFWKTIALWRAAKQSQKNWFVAIIVVNGATIGILEIVYLFGFAKEKLTIKELKSMLRLGHKSSSESPK